MEPSARRHRHERGGPRVIGPPTPIDPATARNAVVLSGGGVGGAYEIGVLRALYEGRPAFLGGRPPLRADVFTGTSVGSYNAAFLAQYEEPGLAAIDDLAAIWRHRICARPANCGNGIYRYRLDPTRYLDPGCLRNPLDLLRETATDAFVVGSSALLYGQQVLTSRGNLEDRLIDSLNLEVAISREPLEELLRDTIDLDRLRRSPNELAVVVSDWQNAKPIIYKKADVTDRLGLDVIVASTAIPGVFAAVDLDGIVGVDGGLLMNTPFKPAVQAGAQVLHVIYTDPYVNEIPLPPLPSTVATLSRLYSVLVAAQFNADARHAATINAEIFERAGPAAATAVGATDLPAVRVHRSIGADRVAGRVAARAGAHGYRPIEIHRYRPRSAQDSANNLLDFSWATVERLMQAGYEETLEHDCHHSECVIPQWQAEASERTK